MEVTILRHSGMTEIEGESQLTVTTAGSLDFILS